MPAKSKVDTRFSPLFVITVAALAVSAATVWVFLRVWNGANGDLTRPEDLRPSGRWNYGPEVDSADRSGEELARVLSLPYVNARQPAPATSGVTVLDGDRVAPGVNLYVSAHEAEVMLIDADGRPLHRWGMTFEEAFENRSTSPGTAYFRRAQVFPNGDLLAIFHSGGMIKLDRDSHLIWGSDVSFYNDLFVADDGRIWSLTKEAVRRPEIREGSPVLEDFVAVLSPDGELVERISILEAFLQSPYVDLIRPLPEVADIFHTNTIEVMDGHMASYSPLFGAGRILLSQREIDTVSILDPLTRRIERAWRGPWVMQHQPTVLPNGMLMIFDNRGADGRSRVLQFDTESDEIVWEYRGKPGSPLRSPEAGSAQLLSNGNILITESERGRAIEITAEGEPVWEFVNPHRGGRNDELIATLFEVVRLDFDEVAFVAPSPDE